MLRVACILRHVGEGEEKILNIKSEKLHPEGHGVMKVIKKLGLCFVCGAASGAQITAVAATCLQELARLLLQVAANPKQPQFAHYLFESIAAIVKHCPVTAAEERLFPAFNILLQQDVQARPAL